MSWKRNVPPGRIHGHRGSRVRAEAKGKGTPISRETAMKTHARLAGILLITGLLLCGPMPLAAQGQKAASTDSTAFAQEQRKQADLLYSAGRVVEARALYLRLAPSFAKDFEFNKRLGDCFSQDPRRDLQQAARYYARAYALNPKDPELEMNLGRAYNWTKQYKAAIAVFQRILAREPYQRDVMIELARAQGFGGEVQQARTTYQAYLQRWPGDRDARLEYAAFLSWNKQPEGALEEYRYILRMDPLNLKARLGETQILAWQGNLRESLRKYDDILRDLPDNEDALRGKAFVLLWLQRYEEAGRTFEQAIKKKPADKDVQEALQQIARWKAEEPERQAQAHLDALRQAAEAAASKGDYPQAIELLRQVVARAPQAPLRFRLGQFYLWSRQPAQAIEIFQGLYAERPEDLAALRELGNAQIQAGRPDDAIITFRGYLQRSSDPAVQASLARLLSWSGKSEEAKSLYQQILHGDANNLEASLGLAQVLSWQAQYQQALEQYNAVLQRQPGNRDALLGKAQVLHWSGEPGKALAVLETMQETWPQDREIASVLQSVRSSERQRAQQQEGPQAPVNIDERIRAYRQTVSADPLDVNALQALGELYEQKKDYRQAASYYEAALAIRPRNKTLRLALAKLASWNGDFPRSISVYQGLLAEEPDNRDYRMELAKMLSWSGRKSESVEQYRQILKANANDLEARLGLARVLSWNKQLDEALAEYAAALNADPTNRDALVERARVLSWKGELSAALKLYDSVLIHAPTDRDARFGKAQTLYWSGRIREARAILEDIQAKEPKDRDVGITLASVQNALGRGDLALRQLDQLDKLRVGDAEVERMRQSLRLELRPLLTLRFGPSVDSDDLRIYQSSATVYFSVVPRVRSYVYTGFVLAQDPSLGQETARETLFGSSSRVTNWLRLRGEIGANSSTAGHADPIGEAGATLYATNRVQFDLGVSRRFINYTTQPIRQNISRVETRAGWDWQPDKRTTIHLDYFHQRYSDTNRNNGGNLTVTRNLVRRERFELDAGYLFYVFGFSKNINSGFWSPSFFQRHASFANLRDKLTSRMGLSFWGSLGANQSHEQAAPLEPFRLGGTTRVAWDYATSDHLKFTLGYGYFSSSEVRVVNSRSGGYKAHFAYVTLEYRF